MLIMEEEGILEILRRRIQNGAKESMGDGPEAEIAGECYTDPEIFEEEEARIFRSVPLIAAHSSQLPGPGSFLRHDSAGLPILITRDRDGRARAFLNACSHRNARLENERRGSRKAFRCPYHSWTYGPDGALLGMPAAHCFTGLKKEERGLTPIPVLEAHGFIWIRAMPGGAELHRPELDQFLGEAMARDLSDLRLDEHVVFETTVRNWRINWKLVIEGVLESYHFATAHAESVAPRFYADAAHGDGLGEHFRFVVPCRTLPDMPANRPGAGRRFREHTFMAYTLFPLNTFFIEHRHIAWLNLIPRSHNEIDLALSTLVPRRLHVPRAAEYWRRNHQVTLAVLAEDSVINESQQQNLEEVGGRVMRFGTNEAHLARFHENLARRLGGATALNQSAANSTR